MKRSIRSQRYVSLATAVLASAVVLAGCGGGGGNDLSYTNPDWRSGLSKSVSFPLPERITLRVALANGTAPADDNPSLQWLEKATNIDIAFEVIPSSPGDVDFGSMMRKGNLQDIVQEGKILLTEDSNRRLLVDFREFPNLVPKAAALAASDQRYRNGLAAKITLDDQLYSLGSFDPDQLTFVGSLVYRKDLFKKNDLAIDSWDDLEASLQTLKKLYPQSAPLGGFSSDLFYKLPAMFGSGMTQKSLLYYNTDRGEWVFGPAEDAFKAYVGFASRLYKEGILLPEIFMMQPTEAARYYATDTIFLAPQGGPSGPYFRYPTTDYGAVTDQGVWNGEGKWFESMPLPATPTGVSPHVTSDLYSFVGQGWNVYNQSEHVAEAVALLDFLFDPINALSVELGPPGTIWKLGENGPELLPDYAEAYNTGALGAVLKLAKDRGYEPGLPLFGLHYGVPQGFFGLPDYPGYQYYVKTDVANYRPGMEIPLNPGLRISQKEDFDFDRATAIVSLQTYVEGQLSQFIVGQRSFDEYDAFLAECSKRGADDLVKLYTENSNVFSGEIFSGN